MRVEVCAIYNYIFVIVRHFIFLKISIIFRSPLYHKVSPLFFFVSEILCFNRSDVKLAIVENYLRSLCLASSFFRDACYRSFTL